MASTNLTVRETRRLFLQSTAAALAALATPRWVLAGDVAEVPRATKPVSVSDYCTLTGRGASLAARKVTFEQELNLPGPYTGTTRQNMLLLNQLWALDHAPRLSLPRSTVAVGERIALEVAKAPRAIGGPLGLQSDLSLTCSPIDFGRVGLGKAEAGIFAFQIAAPGATTNGAVLLAPNENGSLDVELVEDRGPLWGPADLLTDLKAAGVQVPGIGSIDDVDLATLERWNADAASAFEKLRGAMSGELFILAAKAAIGPALAADAATVMGMCSLAAGSVLLPPLVAAYAVPACAFATADATFGYLVAIFEHVAANAPGLTDNERQALVRVVRLSHDLYLVSRLIIGPGGTKNTLSPAALRRRIRAFEVLLTGAEIATREIDDPGLRVSIGMFVSAGKRITMFVQARP